MKPEATDRNNRKMAAGLNNRNVWWAQVLRTEI